jgi:hypothetical protein
MWACCCIA